MGLERLFKLTDIMCRHSFLSVNFNQSEMRAMANLSKDSQMVKMLKDNLDVIEFIRSKLVDSKLQITK
jgi:DNA polymerase I-like protein with 3'-5' exonuclease and polymerase domains